MLLLCLLFPAAFSNSPSSLSGGLGSFNKISHWHNHILAWCRFVRLTFPTKVQVWILTSTSNSTTMQDSNQYHISINQAIILATLAFR